MALFTLVVSRVFFKKKTRVVSTGSWTERKGGVPSLKSSVQNKRKGIRKSERRKVGACETTC
jgi:hypothetical protein